MTNIVNNAVNSNTTSTQTSFTNDTKGLIAEKKLSFIEQLIIEQQVWADGAFKTSNDMLYSLLAKCYEKYEIMCTNTDEGKQLRTELNDYITLYSINVNIKSHTINRIVKCVFGADRRRVSAYSIVLRAALEKGLSANAIADFIRSNGGVEEIRLGKRSNALSTKEKVALAKTTVDSNTLAEVSSEAIAIKTDAAQIGQQLVFVATQQANGKFVINAVTNSKTAVNAALVAYYSDNKEGINKQIAERNIASNDAELTQIINKLAA